MRAFAVSDRLPVYFLIHLPKNAGQTIASHLAQHCDGYLEPRRHDRSLGIAAPQVRALSGHWLNQAMESPFAGREIRRTVLFRDPVGLHHSLYNYRMMNYLAKGLGTYSFDLHLASTPRNYQAYCLLTRWLGVRPAEVLCMSEDRQFERLDRMLEDFWFVGDYRDCDRLIAAIAPDLGVPSAAPPRNERRQWAEIVRWQPTLLDERSERAVRDASAVDQALWERWTQRREHAAPRPSSPPRRVWAAASTLISEGQRRWLRDAGGAVRLRQKGRVRRADAARARGDWSDAVDGYRRAIGNSPGTPSLWIELARAARRAGDERTALHAFDRALALKCDMPSIRSERGDGPGVSI